MTPLTPKRTVWMKWVFPYAAVLLVCVWNFHETRPDYMTAALVFIMMVVIMFFVSKQHNKQIPDQVLDGGTFLLVTFGRMTERIPFSNVASMDAQKIVRLTRIVLRLRERAAFGDTLTFYPFQDRDPSGRNVIAVSLQGRISDASV